MAFVGELDDLAADLEVDGELVRRTVFSRAYEGRGWATVVLVHEERGKDGAWKAPRLVLVRLRRAGEGWKTHAQVALPADQVRRLLRDLAPLAPRFEGVEADPADDGA